jgi:hypothetical protein
MFLRFSNGSVRDLLLNVSVIHIQTPYLLYLHNPSTNHPPRHPQLYPLDKIKHAHAVTDGAQHAVPVRSERDIALPVHCAAQILELKVGLHGGVFVRLSGFSVGVGVNVGVERKEWWWLTEMWWSVDAENRQRCQFQLLDLDGGKLSITQKPRGKSTNPGPCHQRDSIIVDLFELIMDMHMYAIN